MVVADSPVKMLLGINPEIETSAKKAICEITVGITSTFQTLSCTLLEGAAMRREGN